MKKNTSDDAGRSDGKENEQRAAGEREQCVVLLRRRREDDEIESVHLIDEREREEEEPSGAMIQLAENPRPFYTCILKLPVSRRGA
jgi:hypothetical protein